MFEAIKSQTTNASIKILPTAESLSFEYQKYM